MRRRVRRTSDMCGFVSGPASIPDNHGPRSEGTRLANKKMEDRETAVSRLVELFFELGYEGTSLKAIEARTGLGRASLYNYFPGGKTEMARAVLVASDQWGVDHLIRVVQDSARPASERLQHIVGNLDALHARPSQLSPANAFCIGGSADQFSGHVQHHFHGLVEMMSGLMAACGVPRDVALRRAWEFRVVWEGALVCTRVLGDLGLYRALMARMPAYLLAPADTPGLLAPDAPLPRPR